MIKTRTFLALFLPLTFVAPIMAQSSFSHRKVDSLTNLIKSSSNEKLVEIYKQLSSQYLRQNSDTAFLYANLSFEYAKKDKSDLSFYTAYKSLGEAYYDKNDFPSALENLLKANEYCERLNEKGLRIAINLSIGNTYRNLKRYSESINIFLQALDVAKEIEDFEKQGLLLYRISLSYYDITDYNKALEYAIKAANILNAHNIESYIADSYNFIGYIHMSLKNNDLANDYFLKAHAYYLKENNIRGLSSSLNNIGIIYNEKKDNEKAIEYYSKSLEYAKQLNDKEGIATSLNNIGLLSVEIGQINKGIDYYFQALAYSVELYDKNGTANLYNNIAGAYLKANNYTKAQEFVNKALSMAKDVTELSFVQESYQILADIYSKKGDYKKAFEFQAIQLAYNDSLYFQQRTSSIAEMQTRFETEAKEKEIQLLKKDNEINILEVDRHKILQKYLALSAFLFLALTIVILIGQRRRRKTSNILALKNKELEIANKKLLESEQNLKELNATKDKFFSIIAHDLKNPFNALLGFSELLEKTYDSCSEEEKKEYINVIYESSQNLFKLLDNLLQWSRTQTNSISYHPERFDLSPLIMQEVEFLHLNAEKKKISINVDIKESAYAFADKNIISSIIRNLISNAIKFTNINGQVDIVTTILKTEVQVSISDSGIGIDSDDLENLFQLSNSISNKGTANEDGTGLGLLLCKEFTEMNHGRIWATSEKGRGSTFYFTIPKQP